MADLREAMPGRLRWAGQILIISGILHCLTWVMGGASGETVRLVAVGVAYVLVGLGLNGGLPKVRYLAFLVVLVGIVGDYIALVDHPIAVWYALIMLVIDLVAAVLLAASIWRGRRPA